MVIGITDTLNKKTDSYITWVRKVACRAEFIKLSPEVKNEKDLKKCDGLILTGGGDIHPKFYGRQDFEKLLKKEDVIEKQDEFEFKIVNDALAREMPVLGICRGLQVFNVALGGSMIPDLVAEGYNDHTKIREGKDRRHNLEIEKGTMLHWIVESTKGETNTAHHQAVDTVAAGLRVNAKSPDGVIEGLEWEEDNSQSFLQLVQWHPERMDDYINPCSKNLLEHFVLAVVSRAEEKIQS